MEKPAFIIGTLHSFQAHNIQLYVSTLKLETEQIRTNKWKLQNE